MNAFQDLKPQTHKQAIAIEKGIEEMVVKINKDVEESMVSQKEKTKRFSEEKHKEELHEITNTILKLLLIYKIGHFVKKLKSTRK